MSLVKLLETDSRLPRFLLPSEAFGRVHRLVGGLQVIRIDPAKHPLTWDNAKLRLQANSEA